MTSRSLLAAAWLCIAAQPMNAESPDFQEELHAWEARMARPDSAEARALPAEVRAALALEPTEREPAQSALVAEYFREWKSDRVAAARAAREKTIRDRFKAVGLPYPPREIFLRAFKHEMQLEIWARENTKVFRKVATFPLTAPSGGPGPKRREGDGQVPEGCYTIDMFNPKSRFHLSLGLNYPNESDRILADRERPGSEIFIHGGAASIGCLPLGDPVIEEVYLAALDTRARGQNTIAVHIFPTRMEGPGWKAMREAHPQFTAFWENLQPIYDAFAKTRRVPAVSVLPDGRYQIR